MIRSRISIRTGLWIAAASLVFAPDGCKNADTVAGPPLPTATVAARTSTPIPGTPTPTPVSTTASPRPSVTPQSPTPVPTARPTDLSGAWSGSVHYHDPDWWWPCGERSFPNSSKATANFIQNGTSVTGTIHTTCFDAHFEGTLTAGTRLAGTVSMQPFSQIGSSRGVGGPSYIQLSTPMLDVSPSACGGSLPCQVGGFDLTFGR
jgi:hypothetical protein